MKKYTIVHGLGVLFLICGATLAGGIVAAGLMNPSSLRHNFRLAIVGSTLMIVAVLCLGGLVPRLIAGAILIVLAWSGRSIFTIGGALILSVFGFILVLPIFGKKIASTDLTGVSMVDKLVYWILHRK